MNEDILTWSCADRFDSRTHQYRLHHADEAAVTRSFLYERSAHSSLLRLLQDGVAHVDVLQGAIQLAASLVFPFRNTRKRRWRRAGQEENRLLPVQHWSLILTYIFIKSNISTFYGRYQRVCLDFKQFPLLLSPTRQYFQSEGVWLSFCLHSKDISWSFTVGGKENNVELKLLIAWLIKRNMTTIFIINNWFGLVSSKNLKHLLFQGS